MNHGQEPASGTPHRRRTSWLLAVALVALVGSLLGGAVTLIAVWQRTDVDTTTTAQANVTNPGDTGAGPTR